jgi:hypothetical protein
MRLCPIPSFPTVKSGTIYGHQYEIADDTFRNTLELYIQGRSFPVLYHYTKRTRKSVLVTMENDAASYASTANHIERCEK